MPRGRKALLVIDMLNDFVLKGAPLEVPKARGIVANIKREVERAHRTGIPVIYCCDRHKRDDREFEVWPPHAIRGTHGAQVVSEIAPGKGDLIVAKRTYSTFYRTTLARNLKRLGVNHLILTGVCTNICILYTAMEAYTRGYEITVLEDCVAALTPEDNRFALRQVKGVFKPCRSRLRQDKKAHF